MLAVPAYLVSRAVGAPPAERQPLDGDLQLWWLTLWTAFFPFLVLVALMGRAVARIDERLAVPVSPCSDTAASGIAACDSVAAATHTTEALGALVVVAGYLTLVAGWTGTRWLEEPGPRYLAPALPFLAVPLAWWWPRVRRIAATMAAWGGVMMVSAATTFILVSTHDTAMSVLLYRLRHAQFLPTVWTEMLGSGGVWVHAASVVVAVLVLIVRALRSGEHSFAADTLRAA